MLLHRPRRRVVHIGRVLDVRGVLLVLQDARVLAVVGQAHAGRALGELGGRSKTLRLQALTRAELFGENLSDTFL